MARILTEKPFATTGIPVSITGTFQQQPDGSYHVGANSAIQLASGLCLLTEINWTGVRLHQPCIFLAEKLTSGTHQIGDMLLGTHVAKLSKILILNAESGAACNIDAIVGNYMKSWKLLNDAEKAAFLSGAEALVSGGVCGWQSTAFFLDCITPGGPVIPLFSGLLALTSGALCINSLENMSAAAKVAAQEAVKMQNYGRELNHLAIQLGGDSSMILFTPQIFTYCTTVTNVCAGIEDLTRQTVGNIALLFNQTPGLQFM